MGKSEPMRLKGTPLTRGRRSRSYRGLNSAKLKVIHHRRSVGPPPTSHGLAESPWQNTHRPSLPHPRAILCLPPRVLQALAELVFRFAVGATVTRVAHLH